MYSGAVSYTFDRPTPTTSAVQVASAYTYDRPTPVYYLTAISADASAYIYDRPTPVHDQVTSTAVAYTYDSPATTDPTQIHVWDGTQWVRKPFYKWDGANWVPIT